LVILDQDREQPQLDGLLVVEEVAVRVLLHQLLVVMEELDPVEVDHLMLVPDLVIQIVRVIEHQEMLRQILDLVEVVFGVKVRVKVVDMVVLVLQSSVTKSHNLPQMQRQLVVLSVSMVVKLFILL
jgi:hypothetical protein